MNLVTSGNATVTLSACIVGLLLVLPKTNLRSIVRYSLFVTRRTFAGGTEAHGIEDKPQVTISQSEIETSETEVEKDDRVLEPVAG